MSRKSFIQNTLPTLFFLLQYFLVGRRGNVRVPATYFEKEPHMILIYISHCKKTHMDKHCQNYDLKFLSRL